MGGLEITAVPSRHFSGRGVFHGFDGFGDGIHLGRDGAARAFEALGGAGADGRGLMMPIHWGLFDLALHSWRQPIERLVELAGERKIKLWSPEPGRPTEVVGGVEL